MPETTACARCSAAAPADGRFCPACGAPLGVASLPTDAPGKSLTRDDPGKSLTRDEISAAATIAPGSAPSQPSGPVGSLAPGSLLAGRYRIVGPLGAGGMGAVYRAEDLKVGQTVALKFLSDSLEGDAEALARLVREVRVARQLAHPNVCQVFDVDEADGRHFLTMEYVDGEDLQSLLRRIGRLPRDKGLEIARQLCAGLAAAHDRGVLHRDLKPANVMIDGRGHVRIADFGLAGLAEEVHGDRVRAGTPQYMAPEQLTGGAVDERSDIYALGLVLYELFTGQRAIGGHSIPEIMRFHQSDSQLTTPSAVLEELDPAVERVILSCLEKDPGRRPASALKVAAALPGGDPLAAALAAGETPSPELVAAAGAAGGMRPRTALTCLAAVIGGVALAMFLGERQQLVHRVPFDSPPAVLAARAQEILVVAAHASEPVDRAYGYQTDSDYLQHLRASERPDRWDELARNRPAAITFWYRESPRHLAASRVDANLGTVSPTNPHAHLAGEAFVRLDSEGRLLELATIPRQHEEEDGTAAGTFDWEPLFAAAGLEYASFESVEPRWRPAHHADRRRAWIGPAGAEAGPVRVEAAAAGSTATAFRLIWDWTRPEREQRFDAGASARLAQVLVLAVTLAVMIGTILLARRNLRLGRGDRRGAARMATAVLVINVIAWVLGADHVPTVQEWNLFFMAFGQMVILWALLWGMYLALEPSLRRRWPERIVSWERVLVGRLRDPLVGHDLLLGALAGVALVCIARLVTPLGALLGLPPESPDAVSTAAVMGARFAAAEVLEWAFRALFNALAFYFILLVLRIVLRRIGLAMAAFFAIFVTFMSLAGNQPLLDIPRAVLVVGLWLVVIGRLGLVSTAAMLFTSWLLTTNAMTLDFSAWYATPTLIFPITVVALAAYGCWTALADQTILSSDLLDD